MHRGVALPPPAVLSLGMRTRPWLLLPFALALGSMHCPAVPAMDWDEARPWDLIPLLPDESTRRRAYFELLRRLQGRDFRTWSEFQKEFTFVDFMVCPQGPGRSPIYLLWCDPPYKSPTWATQESYTVSNPAGLFRLNETPATPAHARQCRAGWVCGAFTADGHHVRLVGPVIEFEDADALGDLNGDGVVELTHSGPRDEVLLVRTVTPGFPVIFSARYNHASQCIPANQESRWGYQVSDADRDGRYEIAFGPGWRGKVQPEVIFTWDPDLAQFVQASGETGGQVEVLVPAGTKAGAPMGTADNAPPRPMMEYTSLRSLDDHGILRYMGQGHSVSAPPVEPGQANVIPEGFWDMEPKAAALALAHANRSPYQQERFLMAVDDRDVPALPESCSVRYDWRANSCFALSQRFYVLKADPSESFLALAGTPALRFAEIHFLPMDYPSARHLAHVIGWLNQVRSWDAAWGTTAHYHPFAEMRGCLDDEDGTLSFLGGKGEELFSIKGHIWSHSVSLPGRGLYTRNTCMNLVDFLLRESICRQLAGASFAQNNDEPRTFDEPCSLGTPGDLQVASAQGILDQFMINPSDIPVPMVLTVLNAVGNGRRAELLPAVERVLALAQTKRSEAGTPAAGFNEALAEDLRTSARLAARKMRNGDCPEALLEWAREAGNASSAWALQRLSQVDPSRFAEELERCLNANSTIPPTDCFESIARADPERALAIARRLPHGMEKVLAVQAFEVLAPTASDRELQDRLPLLLKIAADPTEEKWLQRARAIAQLVPRTNPHRFTDPRIDDTLLGLLDESEDMFLRMRASQALALRHRTDAFDRIAASVGHEQWGLEILGALASLAQLDPDHLKPRVVALVATNLFLTNFHIPSLIQLAWNYDYRELKPNVERLATSGPEDCEDARTHISGGKPAAVSGRFHRARQVAALWNEEDPLTRAKLLVAFGLEQGLFLPAPGEDPGGPLPAAERLLAELSRAAEDLSEAETVSLIEFIDHCEAARRIECADSSPGLKRALVGIEVLRQTVSLRLEEHRPK